MSRRRLLLLLFCMICMSCFSQHDSKLEKNANKGNAKAQYKLAWEYYLYGDTAQALAWFRKSAEQGYSGAYYDFGHLLDKTNNYQEAIVWLIKAEDFYTCGEYYMKGKGVTKDYNKAASWYEKSLSKEGKVWATSSTQLAMLNLAECHDSLKNYSEALKWYQETYEGQFGGFGSQTTPRLHALLGMIRIYHLGLGTTKNDKFVNELLGNIKFLLGSDLVASYTFELALRNDDDMSLFWTEQAVKNGSKMALYWMGLIYETGRYGVIKNDIKAFEWYQKSAESGDIDALYKLGLMYEKGRGTTQDYERAYNLYSSIVKYSPSCTHYLNAMGHLGIMYYNGYYVSKDGQKAFDYLLTSADYCTDSDIILVLSNCYRYGVGVVENEAKATYWFEKAKEYGSETAMWLDELSKKREEIRKDIKKNGKV